MESRPRMRLCAMIASGAAFLMLIGCNGSNGATGTPGTNGTDGKNVPGNALNVASITSDKWSTETNFSGQVTGVTFGGADKGTVTVNFQVTNDAGVPISGLANYKYHGSTDATGIYHYANFEFALAKQTVAAGGSTEWVGFICNRVPTTTKSYTYNGATYGAANRPSSENWGNLVEDASIPGNYTYTFATNVAQIQGFVTNFNAYTSGQSAAQLGDLSFNPASTQTYRVSVMVGGAFSGTGNNTATGTGGATGVYAHHSHDIIYDFVPATGAAVAVPTAAVDAAACNACHTKLGVTFHTGGERNDPRYCVMCHTDQMKFGSTDAASTITVTGGVASFPSSNTGIKNLNNRATGDLPAFIHRIHNGTNNYIKNFNFNSGLSFNEVTYPQDARNCTSCHVTAADAPRSAAWNTKPGIAACGACHDNVDFVNGTSPMPNGSGTHPVQADDTNCTVCHSAKDISVAHAPLLTGAPVTGYGQPTATYWQLTNPSKTGLITPASQTAYSVAASISKVEIVPIGGDSVNLGNPKITFSLTANGKPVQINATPGSTSAVNMLSIPTDATGATFVGGPSLMLAVGLPQDGIAPADYNYEATYQLVKIWNGSATGTSIGTLTGAGGTGPFTVTLTNVVIPPGTNTMIMGVGYGSNLLQTNLGKLNTAADHQQQVPSTDFTYTTTGGLLVPITNTWMAASTPVIPGGSTMTLARRTIVKTDACNTCHSNLGAFTDEAFHAQSYNDATSCAICHNTAHAPQAGYSINAKNWVHGLHAGGTRTYAYLGQPNFPGITYPGILNDCEACHVAGSYDFSSDANAAQIPNMLWDTVAGAIPSTAVNVPAKAQGGSDINFETTSVNYTAPWVIPGFTYGAAMGVTATAGSPLAITAKADITSVRNSDGTITTTTAGSNTASPTASSLVVSPITAACSGCHDTPQNIAHMTSGAGGGVFYQSRSKVTQGASPVVVNGITFTAPLVSGEACLSCHGSGTAYDIRKVHSNF